MGRGPFPLTPVQTRYLPLPRHLNTFAGPFTPGRSVDAAAGAAEYTWHAPLRGVKPPLSRGASKPHCHYDSTVPHAVCTGRLRQSAGRQLERRRLLPWRSRTCPTGHDAANSANIAAFLIHHHLPRRLPLAPLARQFFSLAAPYHHASVFHVADSPCGARRGERWHRHGTWRTGTTVYLNVAWRCARYRVSPPLGRRRRRTERRADVINKRRGFAAAPRWTPTPRFLARAFRC